MSERRKFPPRQLAAESGSSTLEFLTAGVLLLVPLVYLVFALSSIQAASMAVESAARQGARAYVLAETEAAAQAVSSAAVTLTLSDYGIEATTAEVTISCDPDPTNCLQAANYVTFSIRTSVPLPLFPIELASSGIGVVQAESSSTWQVSPFKDAR